MSKPLTEKRTYPTPVEDARLLLKQCDKHRVAVPPAQRQCSKEDGHPCALASCPLCRDRLARAWIAAVTDRYGGLFEVQALTITPANGRVELDEAGEFGVCRFRDQVQRKMRTALPPGTEVIGALDVSVLRDKQDEIPRQSG